jgi:hypothetical protein
MSGFLSGNWWMSGFLAKKLMSSFYGNWWMSGFLGGCPVFSEIGGCPVFWLMSGFLGFLC